MVSEREAILSVFKKKRSKEIVWQPRIENWYDVNKRCDTLPTPYKNLDLLEVYDKLGCSPRPYVHAHSDWIAKDDEEGGYCPQNAPPVWKITLKGNIESQYRRKDGKLIESWNTPQGNLRRTWGESELSIVPHVVDHPVKKIEDLEILEYILEHQRVEFIPQHFEQIKEKMGSRAPISFTAPRAPFQRLILFYMNYQDAILALHKHTKRMEEFLQFAEEADDRFYNAVKRSPVKVVNFPDNIDAQFDSPPLLKKYLLPHWRERSKELHESGKYTHVHWDGRLADILEFAPEVGVDGFEALTPKPQGDVSLEEIKQALGDELILLDGIPANLFMNQASNEDLIKKVDRLIELFAPNLILGISDELPANAEIEKVKSVSKHLGRI